MTAIVNTSAAKISAATKIVWGKNDESTGRKSIKTPGKMYDFVPGQLTVIDTKTWKELLKVKGLSKAVDDGRLITGDAAKKVAVGAKKATKAAIAADADSSEVEEIDPDSDEELLD